MGKTDLLVGFLLAGAVGCGWGLVSTWLGRAVGLSDLLLFIAVACAYPAWQGVRWNERQFEWDAERLRRVWIENEARAVAVSQPPAPPAPPVVEQQQAHRAHLWRVMAHRFIVAGDAYGFGVRVLADDKSPHKVTTWDGWQVMVKVLCEARVLTASQKGTRWGHDERGPWNRERWDVERAALRLPFPDADPPEITVTPQHHTTPRATTAATAAASGD